MTAPATTNWVAQEILKQLGGSSFRLMTGANNFTSSGSALNFTLPWNFATDGINQVRVELMATDTYTLTFRRVRGLSYRVVAVRVDVYCDSLREVFTNVTGLELNL